MRKGGDSIHRVQTLLGIVRTEAYVPPSKAELMKKEKVELEKEYNIIDDRKLLRENWVPQSGHQNFNLKALRSFLKKNSVFPDQYRAIIWTYLLSLPKNVLAYDNYLKKGAHKDLAKYEKTFPLKNEVLAKKLGRVLSSLSHYCGLFSDQNILPFVTFPFVKLFNHDECLAFEVVITFLMHWGQHLFENFPHPSSTMINYTMQFLEAIDPGLSNYLVEIEAKLGNFYWQAWTNLYTDLLPRSDWLILFDHLVCFPEYIELFPIVIATELSLQREALMSCPDRMTLEAVLEQVKIENIKVTLSRTIDLLAACSKLPGFEYPFKKTIPLTKEIYQAFSFLPKSLTQAKY